MSIVSHAPSSAEARYNREILSVVPASGVWVVRKAEQRDGEWRYHRDPVLVWAVVRSPISLATEVVPMIQAEDYDDSALAFVDDSSWLWSEATGSLCECGYRQPPAWVPSDRWWCRVCAGLIDPER
jgi:hypothetical protein